MTLTTVPLAQYFFTRLRQLGIESVFGVPSDYNLRALDYLVAAGLKWVGDANELNAGTKRKFLSTLIFHPKEHGTEDKSETGRATQTWTVLV
jgi:Thiamine pyrophosphate enzyme, N-terminal TPP binding domain